MPKKLFMMQMYILSKDAFQCSTWSGIQSSSFKRFSSCIMGMYREISGNYHSNPSGKPVLSDRDMLFEYELMSPMTIIRIARLMLFGRLAVKAPLILTSLVRDMSCLDRGWSYEVWNDLKWLALSPDFESCSGFSFCQWFNYVKEHFKSFKRLVNKFVKSRIANIPVDDAPDERITNVCAVAPVFQCSLCSLSFDTFQKSSLHSFKAHGIRNLWRLLIGHHLHCPICLKQFWSRERLINHVRYRSKVCKLNLQIRGPVVTEAEALGIDEACAAEHVQLYRKGKRRHHVLDPVIRLHGPLLSIFQPEGVEPSVHHPLGNGHNYY